MTNTTIGRTAAVLIALFAAGCSTIQDEQQSTTSESLGRELQPTKYIRASTEWSKQPSLNNFSDMYSSIYITPPSTQAGDVIVRDYDIEKRSILARFLSGRSKTFSAKLSISIADPEMAATIPLFSMAHDSSSDVGEVFSTDYSQSNMSTPLFRIGPNTVLSFKLQSSISDSVESQAAATVLTAMTQALSLTSPASPLLTTLSKPEVDKTAQQVDSLLSSLNTESIAESLNFDFRMSQWNDRSQLQISASVPWVKFNYESTKATQTSISPIVGAWIVSMTCPRLSIYDPATVCSGSSTSSKPVFITGADRAAARSKIAAHVSDVAVLQLRLSSQVTLRDFIQTQPWYTNFIANVKGKKTSNDVYKEFCSYAQASFVSSGLNDFDAALAIRAMAHALPVVSDYTAEISANCTAAPFDLYPTVNFWNGRVSKKAAAAAAAAAAADAEADTETQTAATPQLPSGSNTQQSQSPAPDTPAATAQTPAATTGGTQTQPATAAQAAPTTTQTPAATTGGTQTQPAPATQVAPAQAPASAATGAQQTQPAPAAQAAPAPAQTPAAATGGTQTQPTPATTPTPQQGQAGGSHG